MQPGTLFVVATPIGNREDLAPRARQVLSEVDLIAAEDTRHTGRLLSHYGLDTPQMALHEHNEERVVNALIERLEGGASIALVSDAGTPLISDPGYRLLVAAHKAGIPVSPLPGPSAVISALSVAGLPSDRFSFEGFLPARRDARRATLERLLDESRTLVFLESVHRIEAMLDDLTDIFGADRDAFVGREMTKFHEQCVKAPLGELTERIRDGRIPSKGEFVVIVCGATDAVTELPVRRLLTELMAVLPGKQAVRIVAKVTDTPKNAVYELMLELKNTTTSD